MTPATRNRVLGIAASVVLVGLTIALVIVRPIRTYRNATTSMLPTWPKDSRLIVRATKDVHVGDLVAFHHRSSVFAKRIIGGPNDVVEIRDKRLIVNRREINEPYVMHDDPTIYPPEPALPEPYRSRDQFGPYRVPADSWFLLGDNRDRSADSRWWGAVAGADVIGRVIYAIKP